MRIQDIATKATKSQGHSERIDTVQHGAQTVQADPSACLLHANSPLIRLVQRQ